MLKDMRIQRHLRPRALAMGLFIIMAMPFAAQAGDVFNGQTVYEGNCARCHGNDGRPILPGVPDFSKGTGLFAPDSDLVPTLKRGKGLMPGFEHTLSETEILDALAYARVLQR